MAGKNIGYRLMARGIDREELIKVIEELKPRHEKKKVLSFHASLQLLILNSILR